MSERPTFTRQANASRPGAVTPAPVAAPASSTNRTESDVLDRRQVLGLLATGLSSTVGGCVRYGRALLSRDAPKQVSLTIKVVPADADPRATRIARFLATNLSAVGVDASVVPTSRETLYRDVLVNQQFDLYVARFPGRSDPDFLRPLLHSRFVAEAGWQNPFGFADLDVDGLLEQQRRQTGSRRAKTLATLQGEISRAQPFSVVAFPDEIRATRSDRITGWRTDVHSVLGYLSLGVDGSTPDGSDAGSNDSSNESLESGAGSTNETRTTATPEIRTTATPKTRTTTTPEVRTTSTPETPTTTTPETRDGRGVRMALTDARALENLNPLAVAFRDQGVITSLLYDPLGRRIDGTIRPWLADSWSWAGGDGGAPVLEITLREGLQWHDGTPIDAADVAFTYRFISDTALGSLESPVPAPRFRGRQSLVASATAHDDRTVRLSFRPVSRGVARRSLTVPVLPKHVWEPRAQEATLAGIDTGRTVTEALVVSNRSPVGSGALQVQKLVAGEQLHLEPFTGHFLTWATDPHLTPYHGGPEYPQLTFQRAPSSAAAVSMVRAGDADGTATGVLPQEIPGIGRDPSVDLRVAPSRSFYHVGFNARRTPLGNPRFRRAVARLLDEAFLVDEVFDGFATPAASPLARHESLAPDLTWKDGDPGLAFAGDHGELNVERARELFRQAGYRYNESGELLLS